MKLDTFCLEDNSDDDSLQENKISIQTEIKYKQTRDTITTILLCYSIDFELPIIPFLSSITFVKVLSAEDTIAIQSNNMLLKQLLAIPELLQIATDTHLQDIIQQTYNLQQLCNFQKTLEKKYEHYLKKPQPLGISQMTKIIYNERSKLKEKLEKIFQDQNIQDFLNQGEAKLKNAHLEQWKNHKKEYEEKQLPIIQTALNMNKIQKYLLETQEEERYATGKSNRKKNQMIRIVRKIIKKRRPKTQNELFCTQVHSRRFVKRIFQLLLSRKESYPEIFYCLTIKFEKKVSDKIQFTLNNRFKSYLEKDQYIHKLLNEELEKKGLQQLTLQPQMDMQLFFPCFELELQPQELSEAKIVYDMIVAVYEQKEQHRARLLPIFQCEKYSFLETQMKQVDTVNKYQTPQFLKFKSIVEDIKYYLDNNLVSIQKEIQDREGGTEQKQNKKEKVETKLEH